jgi:hypothetical protein
VFESDADETEVEEENPGGLPFDKETFALQSVYSTNDRRSIEVTAIRIHPPGADGRDGREEDDTISMRLQLLATGSDDDAEGLAVLLGQHLHAALRLHLWAAASACGTKSTAL